jgi:hypothetical protein
MKRSKKVKNKIFPEILGLKKTDFQKQRRCNLFDPKNIPSLLVACDTGFPALRPDHALQVGILLGPDPSLHGLRSGRGRQPGGMSASGES